MTLRDYVESHRSCVINWIPLDIASVLPEIYPDIFLSNPHDVHKAIRRMKEQNLIHVFLRFERGKQVSFNNGGPYTQSYNGISWNDLEDAYPVPEIPLCGLELLI